jgi:hypothetical protein
MDNGHLVLVKSRQKKTRLVSLVYAMLHALIVLVRQGKSIPRYCMDRLVLEWRESKREFSLFEQRQNGQDMSIFPAASTRLFLSSLPSREPTDDDRLFFLYFLSPFSFFVNTARAKFGFGLSTF